MTLELTGDTLCIRDFEALGAAETAAFQSAVGSAMAAGVSRVEIDLARTDYLDCAGVGALVGVRQRGRQQNARLVVCLLHPGRRVERLLQLAGAECLFCQADELQEPVLRSGGAAPEACSVLSA